MSGRHAASRRNPIRAAWQRLWAALARVGDEDEGWTDGELAALADRKQLGPQPPARRPQAVTAARVRMAGVVAAIRAVPVEHLPWLQHGNGYSDTTGTFTKLSQEPPPLRAHESVSMTREAMADALTRQQAREWGP